MKLIKRLNISGQNYHLADENIVLELNGCGRGFMTVESDTSLQGKMVTLDVGDHTLMLRWFTGYVERSQPADNGYQRIFVRETAGLLAHAQPISLRHPTLRQLCTQLTEQCGIPFALPDSADYVDKPIPHFTHSGTGYQLLNNIGAAFGIDDYIWQTQPDGTVFIGSYQDSFWYGKPVTLPDAFAVEQQAGNSMTLPVIQSVRPGAELNGRRIVSVQMSGDEMTLTWQPKNNAGKPAQATPMRRQIEKEFPELAGGQHLPRMGRIEAISDISMLGDICDPFRARYAADVQLLDAKGQPDSSVPVYPAVPLPAVFGGPETGMMSFPHPGTVVEIAFAGGQSDRPFIRQVMPFRWSMPAIAPDEQVQQLRAEVRQRATSRGDWQRYTDQRIDESSRERSITVDEEQRLICERITSVAGNDTLTVGGLTQIQALGGYALATLGDIDLHAVGHQRQAIGGDLAQAVGGSVSQATGGSVSRYISENDETEVGGDLSEKVAGIRESVAKMQKFVAGSTWIGSESINLLNLFSQMLDVVQDIAKTAAEHTHEGDSGGYTSAPVQAGSFTGCGGRAKQINGQLESISG
ncbi:MAG: hypothetical protein ACRDDP_10220 [Plesiomonas sp.]|uniref:Phage protein n=1 Tax=Plesiomonas shigelloides TaxID=703 RepID=A0A8I1W614_PLESH|nr:hypothetical protein [Plesiomonas shigelloides]MBO1107910.1 hypothetical protein [Plesiomonas shigelloides]